MSIEIKDIKVQTDALLATKDDVMSITNFHIMFDIIQGSQESEQFLKTAKDIMYSSRLLTPIMIDFMQDLLYHFLNFINNDTQLDDLIDLHDDILYLCKDWLDVYNVYNNSVKERDFDLKNKFSIIVFNAIKNAQSMYSMTQIKNEVECRKLYVNNLDQIKNEIELKGSWNLQF